MLALLLATLALADPVVVAKRDLPAGTRIRYDDVRVIDTPGVHGAYTRIEDVTGATTTEAIYNGEAIRGHRTSLKRPDNVSTDVPTRSRGHPVHLVAAVDGLRPSNEIDLWWRRSSADPMCLLMESVHVLAVDDAYVLLLVGPSEALRIEDAELLGEMIALKVTSKIRTSTRRESRCPSLLSR